MFLPFVYWRRPRPRESTIGQTFAMMSIPGSIRLLCSNNSNVRLSDDVRFKKAMPPRFFIVPSWFYTHRQRGLVIAFIFPDPIGNKCASFILGSTVLEKERQQIKIMTENCETLLYYLYVLLVVPSMTFLVTVCWISSYASMNLCSFTAPSFLIRKSKLGMR